MADCVSNGWDVFKGLTPYIVAILVIIVWHFQKGKEVVANECKAYWTSLTELEIIYNKLEHNADFKSDNFQQFYKDVDNWKAINLPKIDLIKQLTNQDSKFIESAKKLKTIYSSEEALIGLRRFQDNDSAYEKVNRNLVLASINEIKNSLFPYIKYKFF